MVYIPENPKWYVADIVEEFRIEGEPDNVVHINSLLIRADSPEEAHEAALLLGHDDDHYKNVEGKHVTATFRGLRELSAIQGELEHGTELMWSKRTGLTEADMAKLVKPQPRLAVFAPIETISQCPSPARKDAPPD
jgi:hypothetical protein